MNITGDIFALQLDRIEEANAVRILTMSSNGHLREHFYGLKHLPDRRAFVRDLLKRGQKRPQKKPKQRKPRPELEWAAENLQQIGISLTSTQLENAASAAIDTDLAIVPPLWRALNDILLLALIGLPDSVTITDMDAVWHQLPDEPSRLAASIAFVRHYMSLWGYSATDIYTKRPNDIAPRDLLAAIGWVVAKANLFGLKTPLPPYPLPFDTSYKHNIVLNSRKVHAEPSVHRVYELLGQIKCAVVGLSSLHLERVKLDHNTTFRDGKRRNMVEIMLAKKQKGSEMTSILVNLDADEKMEDLFWKWMNDVLKSGQTTRKLDDSFGYIQPGDISARVTNAADTLSQSLHAQQEKYEKIRDAWNHIKTTDEYGQFKPLLRSEAARLDASMPSLSSLYDTAAALPQTHPLDIPWSITPPMRTLEHDEGVDDAEELEFVLDEVRGDVENMQNRVKDELLGVLSPELDRCGYDVVGL